MSTEHGHAHVCSSQITPDQNVKQAKCSKTMKLSIMLIMIFVFFIVEVVVGQLTNSITLIADSFHMLSDFIALCIGLVSVRLSRRKPSSKNTYGWLRAEIVGALVNSVFLASLCFSIGIEAVKRFIEVKEIENVDLLLYVACMGLLINLIGLFIFGHDSHGHTHGHSHGQSHGHTHGHSHESCNKSDKTISIELGLLATEKSSHEKHNQQKNKKSSNTKCCSIFSKNTNLNIRAVFLHVLADALGSVIVIISALLNKFRKDIGIGENFIQIIDPILCLLLVILILASTLPLFKETAYILLQSTPKTVKIDLLTEEIKSIDGVLDVIRLHVWTLSHDNLIGTVHVTCANLNEYQKIAPFIVDIFHKNGIELVTVAPN